MPLIIAKDLTPGSLLFFTFTPPSFSSIHSISHITLAEGVDIKTAVIDSNLLVVQTR